MAKHSYNNMCVLFLEVINVMYMYFVVFVEN